MFDHLPGAEVPRDEEAFKNHVANTLRDHGTRLGTIESDITEVVELLRMGKGFFRTCGIISRAYRKVAAVVILTLALWQAVAVFWRNIPPPGQGQ